ncbi:MAG: hypothetical protein JWO02_3663 [Solirubrobacterales bacterium]|nr:hypothetical protein [Solirubrobacterales bacterium]
MYEYLFAASAVIRADEEGHTAVEYSLILLFVALVLVAAVALGVSSAAPNTISKIAGSVG